LPPAVDTELNMQGRRRRLEADGDIPRTVSASDYITSVMEGLERDELEFMSPMLKNASATDLENMFESMNIGWR
ncbi:MAG: hypothetical protein WCP73_04200, partial [Eubacteriales bacterium]